MEISTKFAVGEKVYIVFMETDGLLRVGEATIEEIAISDSISYYIDTICEPFPEEDIAKHNDIALLTTIKRKLGEYNEKSENIHE